MVSTFRFIANPSLPLPALAWFRELPFPPEEVPTERGTVLFFRTCGQLVYAPDGSIVAEESPVAMLFSPRIERGVLWTVGELHFRATHMRERFPALAKISSAFSVWLKSHPCVYSNKLSGNEYAYFLEGSIKNYDPPVYAFESGLAALRSKQYFVGGGDNPHVLDNLCRALRLRDINCSDS